MKLIVLVLAFAAAAFAQTDTATITGLVTDTSQGAWLTPAGQRLDCVARGLA